MNSQGEEEIELRASGSPDTSRRVPIALEPSGSEVVSGNVNMSSQNPQVKDVGAQRSPVSLKNSPYNKRQPLAQLVSAESLPKVTEFSPNHGKTKKPQEVNVEIKLIPSHIPDERIDETSLEPSLSSQVLENINSRFHKYDIKFQLEKKNDDRSLMMRRTTNAKNKPVTSLIPAASKAAAGRQSKQGSSVGGASGLTHQFWERSHYFGKFGSIGSSSDFPMPVENLVPGGEVGAGGAKGLLERRIL